MQSSRTMFLFDFEPWPLDPFQDNLLKHNQASLIGNYEERL